MKKVSKKIHALLSATFLVSGSAAVAETESVLLRSIFNAHAMVFGVENVFSQDLYFASWNEMLEKVAMYVDENSGGNKKLWDAFITCRRVSETIRAVIKQTRAVGAAQGSRSYQATIRENIQRLQGKSKNDLQKQKEILKTTTFYWNAKQKNNVKDLLFNLIDVLDITIDKVINDYNRQ